MSLYDKLLVGFFLGLIIYILAIKLALSEEITMIEQVAERHHYWEYFNAVHKSEIRLPFFQVIYNFILVSLDNWEQFSLKMHAEMAEN